MLGRKGRVLRVKLGYNPNSSSLGTEVQVLLWGSAALSFLLVMLSTVIRLTRKARPSSDSDRRPDHV